MDKYKTQQKTIEAALEILENYSKQSPKLSPEEELWMRIGREVRSACLIQKDGLRELLYMADADRFVEFVARQRPMEYVIEYFYQKPLKECNLKEIMDGVVINAKISQWFDTVNYTDEGDCYELKFTHSMGLNTSRIHKILHESMFETYGVRTESQFSERSIFFKIHKSITGDNTIEKPSH